MEGQAALVDSLDFVRPEEQVLAHSADFCALLNGAGLLPYACRPEATVAEARCGVCGLYVGARVLAIDARRAEAAPHAALYRARVGVASGRGGRWWWVASSRRGNGEVVCA